VALDARFLSVSSEATSGFQLIHTPRPIASESMGAPQNRQKLAERLPRFGGSL